eukprot:CAMPEP_0202960142 /NCGR_PEP_ID=MMETSP1396-20130829/4290_1 /ASSEMBLY_ACC=CAM_ASM_000872 /TAXON_ID= /ORGANISM="Pseudokeronopsis sp., Strain Brazil" /LENGTH=122 /DNA_ID=CAMNT_0049679149 /DNA_START=267 /DNA_END=635 /DNA_ORIENTATION=-
MFYIQVVLFSDNDCRSSSTIMYFWLVINVVIFYLMVAFGVAKWGAYICWDAHMRDAYVKEAVKRYMEDHPDNKETPLLIQRDDYDTSSDEEKSKKKSRKKASKPKMIKAKEVSSSDSSSESD